MFSYSKRKSLSAGKFIWLTKSIFHSFTSKLGTKTCGEHRSRCRSSPGSLFVFTRLNFPVESLKSIFKFMA